ncbi:ATF4-like protein [Mya arenaria]|uniref:ATF4-like protein n=1 Tax=Mya arenaria TaxID=6604 RepID=A0ABY7DJ66_MYAAR|nr:ATF4-like protein [Mya arenaria]
MAFPNVYLFLAIASYIGYTEFEDYVDSMEFSLQSESSLDEMFGLSADVYAADLGTEGGILDLGLNGGLKPHQLDQQAVQASLEDFILPETPGDLLDDWMETLDITSLLDTSNAPTVTHSSAPLVQLPSFNKPVVSPATRIVSYTTNKDDDEPKKEGMKIAAFELLKALLTDNQKLVQSSEAEIAKVEPVMMPVQRVFLEPVESPEAEVPNLDFSAFIEENVSFDIKDENDGNQSHTSFQDLLEIQPVISFDNGDVAEFQPEYDSALIASIEPLTNLGVSYTAKVCSATPPMSPKSETFSEPSSPEYSNDISTIDTSYLDDSSWSSSVKSSQVYDHEFTKIKSKKKKSRSDPYDADFDHISDKKLRKKLRNKNAATRYRVKKRSEKETLQEQELRLSDKNKEMREKVESLQREIKYMKELMSEINKAKKQSKY